MLPLECLSIAYSWDPVLLSCSNSAGDIHLFGCLFVPKTNVPVVYMQTAAVRIQASYRGSAGRSAAKRRKVGLSLNSSSASLRACEYGATKSNLVTCYCLGARGMIVTIERLVDTLRTSHYSILIVDGDHPPPSTISRSHRALCYQQTQGSNGVRARMARYAAHLPHMA